MAGAAISRRGLDWLSFFVADIQTGFGPFLAVYLTTQKWTQVDIGLVLSVGTFAALIAQLPGGWLVDAAPSKRRLAGWAIVAIGVSAAMIGSSPLFAVIIAAKLLHIVASSVLGPSLSAISLGMVGHAGISERLGRNARFSSMGNGISAGVMGAVGYLSSAEAVFFVTAVLSAPALFALATIREQDIDPVVADGGIDEDQVTHERPRLLDLLRRPALLILALTILLFQLANAAMLPLVGSDVTMRSSSLATLLVAACIVGPQGIVAMLAPGAGRMAQQIGRKPVLLLGLAVLPVRAGLLALATNPYVIVAVQLLDGVTAAMLGVIVPVIVADVAKGTGHFNLAQGLVGSATGVGATLSLVGTGFLADRYGTGVAFGALAGVSVMAFASALALLSETMPDAGDD